MKQMLALIAICMLDACSSNQKTEIIDQSQLYLKEQMKDPSSFQVIKSEIIDTTMMSEYLKDQYNKDTLEVAKVKIENELSLIRQRFDKGEEAEKEKFEKLLNKKLSVYESTANRHLKAINELKQDSIHHITIHFEYRAKNGFGALDKYKKDVKYFPGNKSFKIEHD